MTKIDNSVKKKVPELRFAGFADDWEKRKLSDLFIKGGSGGTPKSTNKAFYDGNIPFLGISDITKSNGFINNTEKHISSDGLNSSAAWIVSKGAISLAMYASVGKLAILNIDAATSQAFYNMIFDDYDLRGLVYQRLNKANELSEWNKLISTGTQSNLNADKVKNFQIYLPKNHDEIKLISTFFKQLDDTISLHQRKLELLKEQKKGYLQKMFPKNGAKVPELRFAGFAGNWEERKLSDISDVTKLAGFEFTKYVRYQESGKIIALRGLNVKNGKLVLDAVKYIDDSDFSKLNRSKLYKNDILFTYVGTVGELAIVPEDDKYYLAPNVARIRLQDHVSPIFVCQMMNDSNFYNRIILPLIATSSQPALSMENIRKFQLLMPDYQEQQKIGSFLKQLDDTITNHQCKLDLLKDLKKGLSQQMFVL